MGCFRLVTTAGRDVKLLDRPLSLASRVTPTKRLKLPNKHVPSQQQGQIFSYCSCAAGDFQFSTVCESSPRHECTRSIGRHHSSILRGHEKSTRVRKHGESKIGHDKSTARARQEHGESTTRVYDENTRSYDDSSRERDEGATIVCTCVQRQVDHVDFYVTLPSASNRHPFSGLADQLQSQIC